MDKMKISKACLLGISQAKLYRVRHSFLTQDWTGVGYPIGTVRAREEEESQRRFGSHVRLA